MLPCTGRAHPPILRFPDQEAEMLAVSDMVMVVFGIIACFMGYSLFRGMLPLWGALLGGWIAFSTMPALVPAQAGSLAAQGIAFAAGGTLGALIARPLYMMIVFLSGAVLGGVMGVVAGALIELGGITSFSRLDQLSAMSFPPVPHTATQFLCMAVLGIALGAAAINFQKFMITASSAYLGAAAIVTGLTVPLHGMASTAVGRGAVMLLAWIVVGLVGLFLQYRMMGDDQI